MSVTAMRFQFDEFVIDGDRRLVTRGSDEIHVAPKTFDCLLVLLAQAPNAVSKAELMATLWPESACRGRSPSAADRSAFLRRGA